jgi:hypothetical protein
MTDTVPIFTKLTLALQCSVKNFCIKFNENPANSTVADMRSWKGTVSKKMCSFLYFLTNAKNNAVLLSEELTLKKNYILLFHGHLFSWHQPQNLAVPQSSNPLSCCQLCRRNTCFNEEYNLTGWKLHVQ